MSWSLVLQAPSKAAAKLKLTTDLPKAMLNQPSHAHDFDVVRGAINGAIDACAEGAISVSGSGSLSGSWVGADVTAVRSVCINLNVTSA